MGPKIAFLGRSNAGKSSLLNSLAGNSMAKVSRAPGKTRTLNCFSNSKNLHLIDLPGFGYSKVSKKEHKEMMESLERFLNEEKNLKLLLVLCDSGRLLPEEEKQFLETAKFKSIQTILVRTKVDKLNQKERALLQKSSEEYLKASGSKEGVFYVSVKSGKGIPDLSDQIQILLGKSL